MYDRLEKLLKERGITAYRLSQETGVSTATLTSWKKGRYTPKNDKLQAIADFFQVPLTYFTDGTSASPDDLTARDRRDIAKDLDKMMDMLDSGEDGPLRYNGEEIDEESRILLRNALELGLTQLKKENKKLYNPNKNKNNN